MANIFYLPYIFVCISTFACWKSQKLGLLSLTTTFIISLVFNTMTPMSFFSITALGIFSWGITADKKVFKYTSIILFIILSFSLSTHLMPGFNNIKVIDSYQFSTNAIPFTMYLNFDKPFVGLFLLIFFIKPWNQKKISKKVFFNHNFFILFILLTIIIPIGLLSNYIEFAPKLPSVTWIWALNNLLVVCIAEEAFFRGFIQKGLTDFFKRDRKINYIIPILIASILFGLAHFKGGTSYVLLSSLAGFFYGLAYHKTGRIESSILVHFMLNLIHFLFLTYPALKI